MRSTSLARRASQSLFILLASVRRQPKIFFGCGCFILLASKKPFTYSHWEQPNAHPKSQKIFYPFTYLELRSRNAPCFYKKFEKYFFRLRVLILLAQKVPSLIPTGKSQMHPLNGKIFPNEKPPHSFGQRVPKCTPISGLFLKNFLFGKKTHLFEIGKPKRNLFFAKRQKNLPASIGGHTFDTKNIIDFLKYSEHIHIS